MILLVLNYINCLQDTPTDESLLPAYDRIITRTYFLGAEVWNLTTVDKMLYVILEF